MKRSEKLILALLLAVGATCYVLGLSGCRSVCPMARHTHRSVNDALKHHDMLTVVAILPYGITVKDQIGVLIDIRVPKHRYTGGDLNMPLP